MSFTHALLLTLLLVSSAVMGAPQRDHPPTPTFLIAEVWPWGYLDENENPAGLIHMLATRLSEHAGIQMRYRVLPHQRVLADFRRSDGDYTMVFQNPIVDDFAERVGVVLTTDMLLLTHRASPQDLTLEALAGKTLGYISGTYYGEAFAADRKTIKLPLSGLEQAIRMLQLGRLDALISSDIMLRYSLEQAQLNPQMFRTRVLAPGHEAHLYVSPGSRDASHLPAVRAALKQMRISGELDEIFGRALQLPPTAD
ncbi:MAG: transporter substrate-binding domain-containing protein [Pseudomonas sp.]|nr:transporter substrate-binding domain-containing protein [Pseudomonas sp.]